MEGKADNLPEGFLAWWREVDLIMKRDWYIDTEEAGVETERLLIHWRYDEAPADYVAWFAEKYDLIEFSYGR